jgi:dTDP-4-dehydrorhamnose 3,5-epimerase
VNLRETELPGAFVIELDPREDERGSFTRVWDGPELERHGLDARIAQCSVSFNRRAGTLRGLHYQADPHAETKVLRCTRGALFDVIVDVRPESPAFKGWLGVELREGDGRALYVPAGFAHGFQTLEDDTEVFYAISVPYEPSAGRGVRWDDPAFAIDWPSAVERTISERDRTWPDFG